MVKKFASLSLTVIITIGCILTFATAPVFADPAPGAPPTNLVATGVSANQIDLSWVDNSNDETGFSIERSSEYEFQVVDIDWTVASDMTTFSDTTTAVGNLYYYRVHASPPWTPDTQSTNIVEVSTYAPAQPIVTVTHLSSNRVDLSWTSDPEASGTWSGSASFQVERATGNPITTWTTIDNNLTYPTTGCSDMAVTPSTDYHYRVNATSVMGSSQSAPPTDITTPSTDTSPEIGVKLNGTNNVNLGSVIDFGNTEVDVEVFKVFNIENTGDAPLNLLGGLAKVVIGGPDAAEFYLNFQPQSPIYPNNSKTFTVVFNPSSPGLKTATVSIANDDPDENENPYTFTIQGTATAPPAFITVYFPSGGDAWVIGTYRQIVWEPIDISGPFTIAISRDNGSTWEIIVNDTANESEYLWNVTGPGTAQAIIKVSSVNNPWVFGESDPFTVVASEIKVSYNGVEIIAGDLVPSIVDGTDFGSVEANDGTISRVFTITNTGTANLELTGYPAKVVVSGDLPLYFSVSWDAGNNVLLPGGGDFTTFTITFDPKAVGTFNAQITIESNDVDENPYIFAISGTGTTNPAPVAVDDVYSVNEDEILDVNAPGVLANDTDDDPLEAILVAEPEHGTLYHYGLNVELTIGKFIYTPDPDFNGTDTFTYKVTDGLAESNIATVSITVNAVNDAPVAVDEGYSVYEDTTLAVTGIGIFWNDTDVDGNSLTATVVEGVAHGTLTAFPGDGSFTYTPDANWFGVDSFTYKVNDGTTNSNVATVTINVVAVNDLPVVNPDTYTVHEGGVLTIPAPGVLGNDSDIDSTLTAREDSNPARGILSLNSNGSFTYTPSATYNGPDSFTYLAFDGEVTVRGAVTLNVTAVNNAPVAADYFYSTNEGTQLVVAAPGVLVDDTDADFDTLTAVKVTDPAHGTLILNSNGAFTYTPAANYSGTDFFTYTANDGIVDSNVATVNITVNPISVNPIVVTSPNGGENWEVFSVQTITWSSTGVSGPVKIELSRDGGVTWKTIVPRTPNDSSQRWIVLRGATTQAKIKVSCISDPALFDISDANFNIVEPSITVISPNGGESWKIGSTQTITWNSTSVLSVKIELSRNGGTTWTTIATGIANHGNKTWKVTGPVTAHARIRVVSLSNSASDISDTDFSITPK
jgi:VCBS repeat-containing protein